MVELKIRAPVQRDEHPDPSEIPPLAPGAMAESKPYPASEEHQEAIGFPGELVDDWKEKAIDKLGELVSNSRGLRVYLDTCVKCGACTDKCHYFLGTADPNNMPVARQDLLRPLGWRYLHPVPGNEIIDEEG